VFPVAAFFSAAGGLGLAAVAALGGALVLRPAAVGASLRRPPLPVLLFAAAIGWYALSYLWSPYDKPDQALKLVLLTPLFASLVFSAARLPARLARPAQAGLIGGAMFGLLVLAFEAATQGVISYSFKVGVEGWEGDREALAGFVDRLLGRSASPLILLAGPAALVAWSRGDRQGRALAGVLLVLAVIAAISFDTDANIAALLAAGGAAGLALRWPRTILRAGFAGAGLMLLATPLLIPAVLSLTGEEMRTAMPTSWVQRLEIWRFALDRIAERPITGWGLDAARELSGEGMVRGLAFDLMPLHAHNAGLHIWMETGLIGAGLGSAALIALAFLPWRAGPARAAGLAWACVAWFVCVQAGYGVWQEWHHGALALALAAAFVTPDAFRR